MQYTPHVPGDVDLAQAVELIFALDDYAPEHSRERLVPNGRVTLVIELDGRDRHVYDNETGEALQLCRGSWLSGVQSNFLTIGDTRPGTRLAAVQFAPGAALPLLHEELCTWNDRVAPAEETFGDSIVKLRERLLTLDSAQVVLEVEAWLLARFDSEHRAPEVIRTLMAELMQAPGEVALTQRVEELGSVSYKHFVELFKRHVGPTPKTMQRILRFAQVFERLQGQERVDWTQISLELGYSDQAHFIRDFVAFSGYRPRKFLEEGHERLNFFPEDTR